MIDFNKVFPERCHYNMYTNGIPCGDWNIIIVSIVFAFILTFALFYALVTSDDTE